MPKTAAPMSDAEYEAQRKAVEAETERRNAEAREKALEPLQGLLDLTSDKKRTLEEALALATEQRATAPSGVFPHLDAFIRSGELVLSSVRAAEQAATVAAAPPVGPLPTPTE